MFLLQRQASLVQSENHSATEEDILTSDNAVTTYTTIHLAATGVHVRIVNRGGCPNAVHILCFRLK